MRKTKYNKSLCDKLIKHMASGQSFETFARVIGVSKTTLNNWVKEHTEFAEAKEEAFLAREFDLIDTINNVAKGKQKGNAALLKLMAVNILKWKGNDFDTEDKEAIAQLKKEIKIKLQYDPFKDIEDDEKREVN